MKKYLAGLLKKPGEEEKPRKPLLFEGEGMVAIISLLFILIEYAWLSKYSTMIGEWEWNWGWAVFFAQIPYLILSFRIVGPTELGVRLFFGKPINKVSSGLVFIPFLICQLKKETRLMIQDEIPGPPEKIWREKKGEEGGEVPKGMVPPTRVPFGSPRLKKEELKAEEIEEEVEINGEKEKKKVRIVRKLGIRLPSDKKELDLPQENDALDTRVTAEVASVIRWHIDDYIKFLTTIGSVEKARIQMEDRAVSALFREFAKITPAIALANLGTYSFNIQREIVERTEGWGIEIDFQIKTIIFHRDLNNALSDVPETMLTSKAKVIGAKAEGAAEKAVLDGRRKGILKMKEDLGVSPALIIQTEAARKIAETSKGEKKVIIAGSGGFADLMAVGSALGIGETPQKAP